MRFTWCPEVDSGIGGLTIVLSGKEDFVSAGRIVGGAVSVGAFTGGDFVELLIGVDLGVLLEESVPFVGLVLHDLGDGNDSSELLLLSGGNDFLFGESLLGGDKGGLGFDDSGMCGLLLELGSFKLLYHLGVVGLSLGDLTVPVGLDIFSILLTFSNVSSSLLGESLGFVVSSEFGNVLLLLGSEVLLSVGFGLDGAVELDEVDGLHNSVQFVGGFSHGEHLLNGSLTLGTDGFVLGNLSSLFLNERLMVGLTLQTVGEGGFDISFLGLGVLDLAVFVFGGVLLAINFLNFFLGIVLGFVISSGVLISDSGSGGLLNDGRSNLLYDGGGFLNNLGGSLFDSNRFLDDNGSFLGLFLLGLSGGLLLDNGSFLGLFLLGNNGGLLGLFLLGNNGGLLGLFLLGSGIGFHLGKSLNRSDAVKGFHSDC
jgi:hypothetical protein